MTHRLKISGLAVFFGLMMALALAPHSVQAGGMVGGGTPGSCTESTFRTALSGGGSVNFNCGAAPLTIVLSHYITVSVDTTIDGGGLIGLSGHGAHRIFVVNSGTVLTLRNIVLTGGYDVDWGGGAIYNAGTLILQNSQIFNSTDASPYGGGAIINGNQLFMSNSYVEGNSAGYGGGLRNSPGPGTGIAVITDSTFSTNTANGVSYGDGGAIANDDGAILYLVNSTLSANNANVDGGGLYNASEGNGVASVANLYNATLSNNQADADVNGSGTGGGIYNQPTFFDGIDSKWVTPTSNLSNTILALNY